MRRSPRGDVMLHSHCCTSVQLVIHDPRL